MTSESLVPAAHSQRELAKETLAALDRSNSVRQTDRAFVDASPDRQNPGYPPIPRWKRVLDVGIIILAAVLVAPVMAVIAIIIRIVSPGPIFFRQSRIGYAGKEFSLLKFRTMQADADSHAHHRHLKQLMQSETPMTKLDAHDPRVIPGGRLLRATGLDELPQLFNVFRGEMSLVGPRPCTPYEYAHYDPGQRRRFASLPGLTGLWQVSGKNRTTFQEMIRLDVRYIETSSIWLDFKILLKTPLAIVVQVRDALVGRRTNEPTTSEEVRGTKIRPVES
ncbi:MAG TPA: sugar transferase [Verrucomicrobiota bacterium]|nr:sugar transferase [Verrucomicrobiota bacterium]